MTLLTRYKFYKKLKEMSEILDKIRIWGVNLLDVY